MQKDPAIPYHQRKIDLVVRFDILSLKFGMADWVWEHHYIPGHNFIPICKHRIFEEGKSLEI
jgi:hypothetical protein